MDVAVKYKPSVMLVCQWNEWAGQPDGTPNFVDSYNISFTNVSGVSFPPPMRAFGYAQFVDCHIRA